MGEITTGDANIDANPSLALHMRKMQMMNDIRIFRMWVVSFGCD